jgi:hypothetical protein
MNFTSLLTCLVVIYLFFSIFEIFHVWFFEKDENFIGSLEYTLSIIPDPFKLFRFDGGYNKNFYKDVKKMFFIGKLIFLYENIHIFGFLIFVILIYKFISL